MNPQAVKEVVESLVADDEVQSDKADGYMYIYIYMLPPPPGTYLLVASPVHDLPI